jgi:hypothetical protein
VKSGRRGKTKAMMSDIEAVGGRWKWKVAVLYVDLTALVLKKTTKKKGQGRKNGVG